MDNKYHILPDLTKDYILNEITQEQIFERYTGSKVIYDKLFACKLWNDTNPSCGFRWSGNKLKMRDFGGHFWGDCFDIVGFVYSINPNSKEGFVKILNIIARDFRIHKYRDFNEVKKLDIVPQYNKKVSQKTRPDVIYIETRKLHNLDIDYWKQFHIITPEILQKKKVFPTKKIWVNNNLIYKEVGKDLCYSYYFGQDFKTNIHIIKNYFPFRKENRFRMNIPILESIELLVPNDILVITKSYKDVICIDTMSEMYGFPVSSIALPSETFDLSKKDYDWLVQRYKYIVSLMDFDRTGKIAAWKLKTKYNIPRLFFTDGSYKTVNYGQKDFSAYLAENNINKTLTLIEKSYEKIIK